MGEAFLDKNGGGGSKINGIIEDYYVYAGENIKAGDFVEFIDDAIRKVTSSNANGIAKTSGIGGSSTAHGGKVKVYVLPSFSERFNLVGNGDFENGVDGWLGASSSSTPFTQVANGYSGKCAKYEIVTPSSAGYATTVQYPIPITAGNIYYASTYIKGISSNYANMQPRISLRDITGSSWLATGNNVTSNIEKWKKSSAYGTSVSTGAGEVRLNILMGGSNVTAGMAVYYDNVRVYDLTAIYGAGNEPDKTWCDENLT